MNSLQYLSSTLQRRNSLTKLLSEDGDDNNNENENDIKDEIEDGVKSDAEDKIIDDKKDYIDEGIKIDNNSNINISYFSWYILNILLFIPKILIYFPLYYIIISILYPFFKFYKLFSLIIRSISPTITDDGDYFNQLDDVDSKLSDSEINNVLSLLPAPSSLDPTSPKKSAPRYAPKSSISTILEESMEFDPDYHENDDYFKSPSDSNPITPSSNLIQEDDSSLGKTSNLNSKLLDIATSSSSQAQSKSLETPLTPTSTLASTKIRKNRKKKKFIFPKLLFNFNIFNPPNLPRKTLVLDLDETLIHSLSRYNSSMLNKNKGVSIEVKVRGNLPTLYHIYKRPYVEEFLSIVYQWFDLVCFTASIKEYADPVIDYLEQQVFTNDVMKKSIKKLKIDPPTKIFKNRHYRNSCIFMEGKGYIKDLSVLVEKSNYRSDSKSSSKSRSRSRASSISSNIPKQPALDYSKIVIIDNSPISYVRHKDNGLMIEGWINDPEDTELMNLLPLLHSLRFVSDVRCILGLKDGQRAFN